MLAFATFRPEARLGIPGKSLLARFVQETSTDVVPVGPEHWTVAVDAFARFGKGRHPAALKFGDCLTYAVARIAAEPLLCVGADFPARTSSSPTGDAVSRDEPDLGPVRSALTLRAG